MKKLLFAALCLMPFISRAQSTDAFNYKSEDRYFYYGDVVQVDTSFSVSDLYKGAKMFIAKLALPNINVTADDQKNGLVMATVEERTTYKTATGIGSKPMTLKYNIKLELKQGRYRYTFDNIVVNYADDDKNMDHLLYDLDKGKGGGLLGVGKRRRVLRAMDALFLVKIELLINTLKTKSDNF